VGQVAILKPRQQSRWSWRHTLTLLVCLAASINPLALLPASAASGDRELYLYYTHTDETARITFRRGGRYDQAGLAKLNQFLRDWRRQEPAKMDPALFDLIWEVYQEARATGPIHVVSAYRAPATNEMLRSKSSGVAENSRHTQGMAMDFFIPGVPISKLREIAMRKQTGGVGYYPTSGSPFVHLDTGNVRAWPRMTRTQLASVFPDGRTLHLPTDGKPLSEAGYQFARAEWSKCRSVPCSGRTTRATVQVAGAQDENGGGKGILNWLFGGDPDENTEDQRPQTANVQVASVTPAAAPTTVPVPSPRPQSRSAPAIPFASGSDPLVAASVPAPLPRTARPRPDGALATEDPIQVASITPATPLPAPRILMTPRQSDAAAALITAYAPSIPAEPDAQRALQILIDRRMAEAAASAGRSSGGTPPPQLNTAGPRFVTAGMLPPKPPLGGGDPSATQGTPQASAPSGTSPATLRFEARQVELVAPDLEHVADIFVDPSAMSSERYAIMFDHDQTDFSPATELGAYVTRIGFSTATNDGLAVGRFTKSPHLLVASR